MSPGASPQPEAQRLPCISCDFYHDLCPTEEERMCCARVNKCLLVQGLILLVVIVHFTISANVKHYTVGNELRPRQSDDLCNHPACDCAPNAQTGMQHVSCNCINFARGVPKILTLLSPSVLSSSTEVLHVSHCDEVNIVKNPFNQHHLVIPSWYIINDVGRLNLHANSVLVGRNIYLQNITEIPELPPGILRLATLSPDESHAETFVLEKAVVRVVRFQAFDSVYLKHNFVINNVKLESIEEGAFNVTISHGNFTIFNSKIYQASSSIMLLDVQEMVIQQSDLGVVQSKAFSVKAETFRVQENTFHEKIHTHAFDVKSKNVLITHNQFKDLDEQAFFKIQVADVNSPGYYKFSDNLLVHTANGSFNPNRYSLESDELSGNLFGNCSSSNIGWIWEAAYGPYVPSVTKNFYQKLLAASNDCYKTDAVPCSLKNVSELYNPNDPYNMISRLSAPGVTNDQICSYFENSSSLLEPTVIIFVQMICFYLLAFLMRLCGL